MVLKIAICDDEPDQLEQTRTLIEQYLEERPGLDAQTAAFSSGVTLLDSIARKGGYDLYILDVLMPGVNGIDVGLSIRQCDAGAVIIYLTTSSEFAVDSYLTRAYHYLLRPVDHDRLFQVLDGAVEQLGALHQEGTMVKTAEGFVRLLFRSIRYAELCGRNVRYHLTDGREVNGLTLRWAFRVAVGPLLDDGRFIQCGTSFVVNLQYVKALEHDGAILDNGERVPISRNFYGEVKNRWMDYWLEGVGVQ